MISYLPVPKGLKMHSLSQRVQSLGLTAAMVGVFFITPAATFAVQALLEGSGFTPTPFMEKVFESHWTIAKWMAVFAFLSLEVQGWMLRKNKAESLEEPEVDSLVTWLARKAGLWREPEVLTMPDQLVNAAATESLFFGHMVIVMGRINKILEKIELEAVLAHEITHLKNWDIWHRLIPMIGSRAISWQSWGMTSLFVSSVFQYFSAKITGSELLFAGVAMVTLWLVSFFYELLEAAHSRCREYLADVGAISLTDWDHAPALVMGLIKVGHEQSGGWGPFRLLQRKWERDIWMPHPPIAERAAALGVTATVLADDRVNVQGTIVKEA